jgi:hypothetical protein
LLRNIPITFTRAKVVKVLQKNQETSVSVKFRISPNSPINIQTRKLSRFNPFYSREVVTKKWSLPVLLSGDGGGEVDHDHLEHGLASRQPVPHHCLQQGLPLLLQLVQLKNKTIL